MKIAVTGSTGLVGTYLVEHLRATGHQVHPIVRRPPQAGEIYLDTAAGQVDLAGFKGIEAVIHLAGENIAGRRWSAAQKQKIRDSRVLNTRYLCEALARLECRPRMVLSASAIGYYGDRADEILTEVSSPGEGFLPSVCQEWESATAAAQEAGIRVALLRFGMILSGAGGALTKMLTPFRFGLGGPIGNGRQYWSWISLDDVVQVIEQTIAHDAWVGPINVVSPVPITNAQFTSVLAEVLRRPAFLPLPALAARLLLGELADGLLLSSARVIPRRLQEWNYSFIHPDLATTLRDILNATR